MIHKLSTLSATPLRTFAAISAALFSTLLLVACSGGPQAAAPFAPSALPSSMLSLEAAGGIDAWGTLGKGNDKGRNDKGRGNEDEDDADDDSDDDSDGEAPTALATVKIEGVVSSVTGTCPAVTFVVGTHSVVTDAATAFDHGLCAQLVPQAAVEVRAVRQTDGTLLAKKVEFDDPDVDDDEDTDDEEDSDAENGEGNPHHGAGPHDGTVSRFRGVCPTVTFNLKGLTILADATTTYTGGTCAALRPNVQVVVTGALLPERRMFKAATITITRTH